jgi:hypothetical protein
VPDADIIHDTLFIDDRRALDHQKGTPGYGVSFFASLKRIYRLISNTVNTHFRNFFRQKHVSKRGKMVTNLVTMKDFDRPRSPGKSVIPYSTRNYEN